MNLKGTHCLLLMIFLNLLGVCQADSLEILDFFGNGFKDPDNIRFASLKPTIDPGIIGTEFTVCASLLYKVTSYLQTIFQILDEDQNPWLHLAIK